MRSELKSTELSAEARRALAERLPEFLQRQRWFGGKAREVWSAEILDAVPIGAAVMLVVGVRYGDGAQEKYAVPVVLREAEGREAAEAMEVVGGELTDGMGNVELLAALLECVKEEREFRGERGSLRGTRTKAFEKLEREWAGAVAGAAIDGIAPRLIRGEQSNSSVIYGDKLILKFIRRMEDGENPDLEIGRFLSERTKYPHIARLAGFLEYQEREARVTQGILQEFVRNEGDAWRHTQKVLAEGYRGGARTMDARLLAEMGLLGRRTAELHVALASEREDAAFVPEEFTREFQEELRQSCEELTARTLAVLRARIDGMDARWRGKCEELSSREDEIAARFRFLSKEKIDGLRIRIHGDYHLGQVLYTGADFVIIDFEGEPARPLAERRMKQSALQDVAGMLRSFEYAAFAPLLMGDAGVSRGEELWQVAEKWSRAAGERFLSEYFAACGGAGILPAAEEQRSGLLKIYLLAKAVYELGYELNNRPGWVGLPVEGILRLLAA